VVVAGRTVVVIMPGAVEARQAATGDEIWARPVPWASVAGEDPNVVVVAGRENKHGFDVIDPETGAVRWNDGDAVGVWTYREAVLSIACAKLDACTVTAREPSGGRVRWRTPVPGVGRVLAGLNHELLGSRELAASTVDARVAAPAELPPMLGFPLDGKVQVVDTGSGRRVGEAKAGQTTRVVVIGGRVLHSTAERQGGRCRHALEARDPATGQTVWRRDGYDLRTASGAGCEQRRDPGGAGGAVAAVRGDNREVLLSGATGAELWVGAPGEQVLSTNGLVALVRAAGGKAVKAVDLGGRETLWELPAAEGVEASLTRDAALIIEDGRVRAVEVGTGRVVIDARTTARVIGCGGGSVILASGRSLGSGYAGAS
jgi:outer membrane protein assembly factor BamB